MTVDGYQAKRFIGQGREAKNILNCMYVGHKASPWSIEITKMGRQEEFKRSLSRSMQLVDICCRCSFFFWGGGAYSQILAGKGGRSYVFAVCIECEEVENYCISTLPQNEETLQQTNKLLLIYPTSWGRFPATVSLHPHQVGVKSYDAYTLSVPGMLSP